MKSIILILICCLTPIILASGQEQQAQKLLSEAVYQEEVNGDLDEAIKTYQRVIKQYPGNRKAVAEAYYHMGMCFEKLGRQDAMNAYREVIRNYADQKDIVVKARGRLAQLEQPEVKAEEPEGLKIRQIWRSPLMEDLGTVSYDGRFRSYVDWGVGDVAIQDLTTGEKKKLTDKASLGDTTYFALSTAISKNGKLIASSWWKPHNTSDLVLVNVDNPTMDVIYSKNGEEVYPAKWLSNMELIAIRSIPDSGINQIVLFNTRDKTFKIQKKLEKLNYINIVCSPDEKYIAYDAVNEADDNTDINLLTVNGGSDIPFITNPANDKVFGWVPGRSEFLFLSDRWGTWDLWAIKLDDGNPIGLPKRIYADIGDVTSVGLTQNGKCYFGFVRRNFSTNITPFNSEKGVIEMGSGSSLKGSNFALSWSPDKKYLAYMNLDNERKNNICLIIRDLETGKEQDPSKNMLIPWALKWSPDGNSILLVGWEADKDRSERYKGGVFTINVKTGQIDKILLLTDYEFNIPDDDMYPLSGIEWSPDSKSFYYLFFKDRLVKHDLETGEDKILFKNNDFTPHVLDLSPNGKSLLFGLQYPGDEKSRLFTMPAEGGKEKELCSAQEANNIYSAFWSPDGKYVYFTELHEGTNLWRVPATGGKPEKTWSSESRVELFDIHPDGNQVAFSLRERVSELRVIDNLVEELERLDKIGK
jgi:Tol biopolymer transport system component